jgi:predicted deacylase
MASGTVEILNVAAKPGQKAKGWHKIAETPLSDVAIPIGIVNGLKPGPTLCITGGVHGSEYPGITAVGETYRDLNPAEISGAVVTVPAVNTLAYERRVG